MAKKSTTSKSVKRNSILAVKEKPMTKSQLINSLADMTDLTRKKTQEVLEALKLLAGAHLGKGAVGQFTLPGLLKMKVVRKAATKARMGKNPFTGAEMMFKSKPARNVVKIKPLKDLKELA